MQETQIEIDEVVSTIRAIDGATLVSPQVMRQLVRAVVQAVNDHQEHEMRAAAERRITGGVAQERDQEA